MASLDRLQPQIEHPGLKPHCQGDHGHLDAPDGLSNCHCRAILLREAPGGGPLVAEAVPAHARQPRGQLGL